MNDDPTHPSQEVSCYEGRSKKMTHVQVPMQIFLRSERKTNAIPSETLPKDPSNKILIARARLARHL